MSNKHLVNIALQHIKDDNPHGIDDIKKGIYNDIDGIHADLDTVTTDFLKVNSKTDTIQRYLDDLKYDMDNLPAVIEARGELAEEVSRSLIDGKINQESAIRISQVLNSLNEAKGYTDRAQIGTEEYINNVKTEVIDYSDTLLYHFEEALGPLAFEDKIELARLGETIIDGGYLKTELIKAHSIGASHINTNELVVGDNIMMGPNAVITWGNLNEESRDNLKGEDGNDGEKGEDGAVGESAYNVVLNTTNGNTFKNGVISTWIYAVVYYGSNDITSQIDANRFRWTRISSDAEGDAVWNSRYFGGVKEVEITSDDVYKRATFTCTILKE